MLADRDDFRKVLSASVAGDQVIIQESYGMLKRAVAGAAVLLFVLVGQVFAENQGAEIIILKSEDFDSVHLSHILHEIKLGDCQVCHKLYAKETDAIEKSVRTGILKRKQVMDQCEGCHSETAIAGKRSGPTSCKGCHMQ